MLNLLSTIYIGHVHPKYNRIMNQLELFNEGIFQFATIHLLIFSDFVPFQNVQYFGGFSMIATMSILIIVNFAFVIWLGNHDFFLFIKKYFWRLRRYLDPHFMTNNKPSEDLSGNLDPIFNPFNALEPDFCKEVLNNDSSDFDLKPISEESSNDL